MRGSFALFVSLLACLTICGAAAQTRTFDIYWVDVEGVNNLTEEYLVARALAPVNDTAALAVREIEGRVVFLRKVIPGAADRSYGIQVAELAGLPEAVTGRAREILGNLEKQELDVRGAPVLARHQGESAGEGQLLLFSASEELVLDKLREVDVDNLTPIAALSLLASFKNKLKNPS